MNLRPLSLPGSRRPIAGLHLPARPCPLSRPSADPVRPAAAPPPRSAQPSAAGGGGLGPVARRKLLADLEAFFIALDALEENSQQGAARLAGKSPSWLSEKLKAYRYGGILGAFPKAGLVLDMRGVVSAPGPQIAFSYAGPAKVSAKRGEKPS